MHSLRQQEAFATSEPCPWTRAHAPKPQDLVVAWKLVVHPRLTVEGCVDALGRGTSEAPAAAKHAKATGLLRVAPTRSPCLALIDALRGGAVTELFVTVPGARSSRQTKDVGIVVNVGTSASIPKGFASNSWSWQSDLER